MKLKFSKGNAKLDKTVWHFSLPAGRTCPGANECRSMAVEINGSRFIQDGPETKFRCFAASQEVLFTNTYKARAHNLEALKGKSSAEMAEIINDSLPKKAKIIRIHVSGDFFSQAYFDAWTTVARANPSRLFYAYTKSLKFWVMALPYIPVNFVLTASVGGKFDKLIDIWNLRYAKVVYSEQEAANLGLQIDHDDTLAMTPAGNFALLIHGVQPAKSEAAKAVSALKKLGKGGYSKKKVTV